MALKRFDASGDGLASAASDRPPVLLVPGAFSSGRVWHRTFAPHFASRGHPVFTLTFRGHGRPRAPRVRFGLDAYVADLIAAIDRIGTTPLVAAHSLGGLVTLLALSRRPLPGVALLAPAPPQGLGRQLVGDTLRDPVSALKWLALALVPATRHLGEPPAGVYGPSTDRALAAFVKADMGPESPRALLDLLRGSRQPIEPGPTPLYFVAAGEDRIVPPASVAETADALAAPFKLYDGMGHSFQAERDWRIVAADVAGWFDQCRAEPASASTPQAVATHPSTRREPT